MQHADHGAALRHQAAQGAALAPTGLAVATPQSPPVGLPAPPPQAAVQPAAPAAPTLGVLLERQPDSAAAPPTPVQRMADIVALLVMALVVLAGAAWQVSKPSAFSAQPRLAGL